MLAIHTRARTMHLSVLARSCGIAPKTLGRKTYPSLEPSFSGMCRVLDIIRGDSSFSDMSALSLSLSSFFKVFAEAANLSSFFLFERTRGFRRCLSYGSFGLFDNAEREVCSSREKCAFILFYFHRSQRCVLRFERETDVRAGEKRTYLQVATA